VVNCDREANPYRNINRPMANWQLWTVWLKGVLMRKIVLLAAAAALVVSPIAADAKAKKKTAEDLEKERIEQEHDNTKRALRDSLPLFLPSWSLPAYFGTGMDKKISGQDEKAEKKTKKAKSTQAQ
jgi:hypothetical protein